MIRMLAFGAALLPGSAAAQTLEFSGSTAPVFRVGVSELTAGTTTLGFGVSNRAVDASAATGIDLSVAGTVTLRTAAAVNFGGGWTVSGSVNGTVGPVALSVQSALWTAPLRSFDPLADVRQEATSTRSAGFQVDASGRYRLQRNLQLLADASVSAQSNVGLGAEWRDGPLSYRAGGRVGSNVLGVTGGLTVRQDDLTLTVDALLGPSSVGVVGSVSLADPLPLPSSLRLYGAYEPWRVDASSVRYGVILTTELGPGTLTAEARGTTGRFGARVGFALPVGPRDDEEE